MTDLQLIRTPADLRPGDIMLGPIGGAVGLMVGAGQLWLGEVFRSGQLSVRHAAIVVQGVTWEEVPVAGGHHLTQTAPPRLVQAMPSGAEEVDLSFQEHWTERHAYVRLPEDYPGQGEDAAAIARLMVREEVDYSFLSYAYLGAWRWGLKTPRVERWINRRRDVIPFAYSPQATHISRGVALPREAICSVLVDQSWSLAGKRVMDGVARQAVTPGALAGQLWRRTGTTWCLPRGTEGEAGSWVVNGS